MGGAMYSRSPPCAAASISGLAHTSRVWSEGFRDLDVQRQKPLSSRAARPEAVLFGHRDRRTWLPVPGGARPTLLLGADPERPRGLPGDPPYSLEPRADLPRRLAAHP